MGLRKRNSLLNLVSSPRFTILTDFENLVAQGLNECDLHGEIDQSFTRVRINFEVSGIYFDRFNTQVKIPENVDLWKTILFFEEIEKEQSCESWVTVLDVQVAEELDSNALKIPVD